MHHAWHPQAHTSHGTSNGINGVNNGRTKPVQVPNGTATANRITHKKSDFYKNGVPAEIIVIDSESPAPQQQSSTKRKRENSISTSTTVSAVTKRARKSQNDETAISSNKSTYTQKPHSVAWFKDERGVYRAREVIVPKVEEVSIIDPDITGTGRLGLVTPACFRLPLYEEKKLICDSRPKEYL
jgi:hypothetical protein